MEARFFLTSYNAVGQKKYLKEEKDVAAFYHELGAKELRAAGYNHSSDK
ncbi:hypothetical protein [Peribacillus sp. ACCC06369]|nr:hypothetical protein [Peribacillus sp. ACCC06369]